MGIARDTLMKISSMMVILFDGFGSCKEKISYEKYLSSYNLGHPYKKESQNF